MNVKHAYSHASKEQAYHHEPVHLRGVRTQLSLYRKHTHGRSLCYSDPVSICVHDDICLCVFYSLLSTQCICAVTREARTYCV